MRKPYKLVTIVASLLLMATPALAVTCFAVCTSTTGVGTIAPARCCLNTTSAEQQDAPDVHLAALSATNQHINCTLSAAVPLPRDFVLDAICSHEYRSLLRTMRI